MAGVFGAHLMSYLRLLTPRELNRLVKTNDKKTKVSLTGLVASELDLNLEGQNRGQLYSGEDKKNEAEQSEKEPTQNKKNINKIASKKIRAVSYTHLTLPTKA